jgi:acyl carrier protein
LAVPCGIEPDSFHSAMLPESIDQMTGRIGTSGFDMVLSGQVPLTRAPELRGHIAHLTGGRAVTDIDLWAVHPGGRSILGAVGETLGLNPAALGHSREVLRRFGNMSSATIMFVLSSTLNSANSAGSLGCGIAFGPGLTAESMILRLLAPTTAAMPISARRGGMMLEQEIVAMIQERVRADDSAPLTPASRLDELGLESLDVIELAFDLEERFKIEIPFSANNDTSPNFTTIGEIAAAVQLSVRPRY